jgi:hypothetical protein
MAGGAIAMAVKANRAQSVFADENTFEFLNGQQFQTNLPSIYIEDETDPNDPNDTNIRRVIDNFDPTRWVYAIKNVRGVSQRYRKGSNYLKLLIVWETCCLCAIHSLLKTSYKSSSVRWLVGWTFSSEHGAKHVDLPAGHAICLNPVTKYGTLRYKSRSYVDHLMLMALAKHEVAHIIESYHNEDYASVLTDIDGHFDVRECLRLIRVALDR